MRLSWVCHVVPSAPRPSVAADPASICPSAPTQRMSSWLHGSPMTGVRRHFHASALEYPAHRRPIGRNSKRPLPPGWAEPPASWTPESRLSRSLTHANEPMTTTGAGATTLRTTKGALRRRTKLHPPSAETTSLTGAARSMLPNGKSVTSRINVDKIDSSHIKRT
ncbi:hypothetical protein FHU36_000856 [Nonomuraea muscovyensis]|uniref:Uncharacterized protein n=1 Tax=Nonomuraea muscovyensis TaxID=1124761 RepID=A0A7X0BX51_9ACTN|nr:hypothetical protein [Nonomuraea muscovyensis]